MKKGVVLTLSALLALNNISCRLAPSQKTEIYLPTIIPLNTPTNEADPIFDLSIANQVPPEDILEEISFYVGGGGPGISCGDARYHPTPDLFNATENLELGCTLWVESCGWKENELVNISLIYPDGNIQSEQEVAPLAYPAIPNNPYPPSTRVVFTKTFSFSDPPGSYTIVLQGESGRIEDTFPVNEFQVPRFYYYEDRFLLRRFQPNEHIRVFAYDGISLDRARLRGWQGFSTDESGELQIYLEGAKASRYVVVGDASGQVDLFYPAWCGYEGSEEPSRITKN